VIRKTTIYLALALGAALVMGSYASDEKTGPQTVKLESLAAVYDPVTFSHDMHSLVAEDCAACHHRSPAGQTPACSKCHRASADSKESGLPGLKDAYHGQCIGCHKKMDMGPRGCKDCHAARTAPVSASSKAPAQKPVKQATATIPETLTLSSLENRYDPATFSHGMHTQMTEDCATCHHHSPGGQTPSCGECHGAPFDPKNLNMPGLKGAYHLQCLGCHKEMGAGPSGCTQCHSKKASQTSGTERK
jgi:hypothetical protein